MSYQNYQNSQILVLLSKDFSVSFATFIPFCLLRSVDSSSSSTTATPVASSHNGSWDEVGGQHNLHFTLLGVHCLINKCYPQVFKYLLPCEANKNIFDIFLLTSPSWKPTLHSGFTV